MQLLQVKRAHKRAQIIVVPFSIMTQTSHFQPYNYYCYSVACR
jgi:hypothetical protein